MAFRVAEAIVDIKRLVLNSINWPMEDRLLIGALN
jgi:hypothetical protein